MRCLKPRTVGFKDDGKTIAWSQKNYNKEFATFQLPCSKCLECRLEYARQWAVRCVHEAKMYENNSFITLTYDDDHLLSPRLQYKDFQEFIAKLRDKLFRDQLNKMYPNDPQDTQRFKWKQLTKETRKQIYDQICIGYFVTGEYGDQRKRPHWHVIIFNWCPKDLEFAYQNDRGDRVFHSKLLTQLWGKGRTDLGSVTFESAGYVARYAAKKLVHGPDGHSYQPISRKSSKQAIGKRFLERYWEDIFNHGHVVLLTKKGDVKTSIPRYYEKWLAKHKPNQYYSYVTRIKSERMAKAQEKSQEETKRYWQAMDKRARFKTPMITKAERKSSILKQKFDQLQKYLKDL